MQGFEESVSQFTFISEILCYTRCGYNHMLDVPFTFIMFFKRFDLIY
jgi:hypothetical protein